VRKSRPVLALKTEVVPEVSFLGRKAVTSAHRN
jgi:hypothetical protein